MALTFSWHYCPEPGLASAQRGSGSNTVVPEATLASRCTVWHAQSCPALCNPTDCSLPGFSVHADFPGKNTGLGCQALLQGIFPTQGSNPILLHCRQILYHLSHQASPRILEWVSYPFSRGSFQPRNRTGVSCLAEGFFTSWATRDAW